MNSDNSPIVIMKLGIKFNKINKNIRKIECESFQIDYNEKIKLKQAKDSLRNYMSQMRKILKLQKQYLKKS